MRSNTIRLLSIVFTLQAFCLGAARADELWSLQPIDRPEIPAVRDGRRVKTAIDAFIQSKLEANGLSIGPAADRRTLIRRLKFDLHGLPPTPGEVHEFVNDKAPDAYERLVDRLLDSPRYGERWARHWLDVVRFAESHGYERDRIRENAWRYRDWVIQSLNEDKPYRDFVREQIAGDALRPDDPHGAVATGFLVTGPNNDVGNQSKLELMRERSDELDEIVQNVSSVFLGLTVACARCHDHKFDPVPIRDYYRMAAVFSGVKFGERPLLAAREATKWTERIAVWDTQIKEINQKLATIRQDLEAMNNLFVNTRRNEESFEPVGARFVRFTITATAGATEPCFDEIEIYGPNPSGGPEPTSNLALASRGAKATASSLLPGYPIHQIHHLNDGITGNSHSWISNEKGAGWAQIELAEPATIGRVVWSRDRNGQYTDRLATEYLLEYSNDGQTYHKLPTVAERLPADAESAAKVARLRNEQKQLLEEKKTIENERSALDRFPKSWAALSVRPEPLQVLNRGDVLAPGDDAPPGALSSVRFVHNQSAGVQTTNGSGFESNLGFSPSDPDPMRRLKLAEWISDPSNPLTWRVIVNRIWHYHFGAGLVTTPSDLGFAGAKPTHPELIDWLADEFRRSGGRFKAMHRMIVRSAAYRQASPHGEPPGAKAAANVASRDGAAIDATNQLLWRPNRRRLDAESLRDSILFISGSLDLSMGGPGYRPFKYIDGNIPVYEAVPESAEQWRRTIYRHVVRTQRQPFLDTFDCPDPSVLTPARTETTTPLQALSLLNNPFVLEQARRFESRLRASGETDPATLAQQAIAHVWQREPSKTELRLAVDFIQNYGLDRYCRVLFNTNEFLYVE